MSWKGESRMSMRGIAALMTAAALAVALAIPVSAGGAQVTSGRFETLPGGVERGFDVNGFARMVRSPAHNGSTYVTVRVSGLDANTTYGVHVHNLPCDADPPGGGHYQHIVGGAVDAVNEIWPAFTTNAAGIGVGRAWHGHWARPDAQAVVIHWPDDPSVRLACADLD